MDATELERRIGDLRRRLAELPAEEQERALDGWAEVLTLCELPREPGEEVTLLISLDRSTEVTHLSG
jgi:hypothetical protein